MASGQPVLTRVEVDGINVSDYIKSWNIKDTEGDDYIKYASILLDRSVSQVLTLSSEALSTKTVVIYRGASSTTDKKVFSGEVTNYLPNGSGAELKCADKLYIANRKILTKSWDKNIDDESGVISEIFKSLINDYTDGDLEADDTSVTSSGTSITLKKFIARAETVYGKCKELADSLGWIFFYKPSTGLVYFEPKATTNQSTSIQNGVNLIKSPVWNYECKGLINYIEARGAVQNVETTLTGQTGITTNFSTTDVTLDFAPISAKVYATAANPPTTLRVGGKSGVTGVYDYSVDQEQKQIVWNKDYYTPTDTTTYVQVDYTYGLPTPVIVENPESQDLYGIKKRVIQLKNIKDVDDAYTYAQAYLDDYDEPILTAKLEVLDISDLEVGQQVRVIDTTNDIDEWLIVNSVEMRYPYNRDLIRVGTFIQGTENLLMNIIKKVKNLEEENISDEELLSHYYPAINNIQLENRFVSLYNNQNSLILDHATRGLLDGTNVLAGGTTDAYLVKRMPGENNTYKEYVYDNYFYKVSSSASTTWNSTTETITCGTTGYFQTEPVSKGMDFTEFRLNISSTSGGTKTYTVRGADDASWQTPSMNTWTEFSGTVDAVSIKVETAGSTATFQNTYQDTSEYNNPAIKLELRE